MKPRCGARLSRGRGICRQPRVKGRNRCWAHGGHTISRLWPVTGRKYEWAGRARKQAIMRALGLPWYGGRNKTKVSLSMAEKAIAITTEILERLPVPRDVPDSEKGDLEIFGEGVRASVVLLRDTVQLGQRLMLDEHGNKLESVAMMHPQDLKLLGMAQITALGLTKQGFKVADRAQRNDIIGKLIAAIEAEKAIKGE